MIFNKLGVIIVVINISKIKFKPISPRNKALATLFGLISVNRSIKNIKQKTANNPVLIIGIKSETTIEPIIIWFFFLKIIITSPATTPERVVFNRQVKIVPTGFIA